MKTTKCLLALLLALVMCLSLLPASAMAEEGTEAPEAPEAEIEVMDVALSKSGTCGDSLSWTLSDAGTLTISGTGAMPDYALNAPWPAGEIKKLVIKSGVDNIGNYAFANCSALSSVSIPSPVKSIGQCAFYKCTGLTTLVLPEGVTSLGLSAFEDCTALQSVTIPSTVNSIDNECFSYCSKLKSVELPSGLTVIANHCFTACTALTSVTIPAGVTVIDLGAFQSCRALTSVTIPASVTEIDEIAFAGCKALKTIYFAGDMPDICPEEPDEAWDGAFYNVTANAYYNAGNATYTAEKLATCYGGDLTWIAVSKPAIKTQPKAQTVAVGKTASFKVAASGGGLSYQWQYKKPGDSSWTNVSTNGTSATYSLTTAARHNGYTYRCKVTNAMGSVYSSSVKLTVVTAKPVITTQPKAVSVTAGKTATFKVAASGTALSYQWQYKKPGGSWTNVSRNGTSATYSLTTAARHNGYVYRCKVTNAMGSVFSGTAKLTVK